MDLGLVNALWLLIVVFMLHDFEEIISVEHWAKKKEFIIKEQPNRFKHWIYQFWNISSHSFAKRDVFVFLFVSMVVFLKVQFIDSTWMDAIFIVFLTLILLHNIAHIIQTVIIKTYTPGLYTTIGLVTPYTIYLFSRLV